MARYTPLAALLLAGCAGTPEEEPGWVGLFNGRDFEGWEVYVGSPGKGLPPRGLNRDPDRVFSIVETDGAPALRISGQTVGGISTKAEFGNFHFRVEFKWGTRTWPPRQDLDRDSGIFYWATGPHGAAGGAWLQSIQSNVMEKDYGTFWPVGGTLADIEVGEGTLAYDEDPGTRYPVYRRGGPRQTFGPAACRATPIPVKEGWNVAEVIGFDGTGLHLFNGQVTLVLRNARRPVDGKVVPLRKGRLQLQSEGAEIYYRRMEIRKLYEVPARYREHVTASGK